MPAKLERCVEKLKEEGKEESSAYAICNKAIKDSAFNVSFSDLAIYDAEERNVVSVRDGVQKYMGHEIGMEPEDKVFYIYRAPETIRAFAGEMEGLPVTDDHVPLDALPVNVIGAVLDSRIIDSVDPITNTTISVKNKIQLDREMSKQDLSLGYFADLIPCDLYDFEQVDIVPHHLAVVERGRCGNLCKFTDKENEEMPKKMNAAFLDANGQVNMQQVLQLVAELPEAIKTLPLNELNKLVPALQKAVDIAQASGLTEEPLEAEETPEGMEPEREVTEEVEDEGEKMAEEEEVLDEKEPMPEEEKKKEMADSVKSFTDAEFNDAVAAKAKELNAEFAGVVSKAQDFLPSNYNFSDKCSCDVMRDALATQHDGTFEDKELPTAFKMLKKVGNYKEFGDSKEGLAALADKEI